MESGVSRGPFAEAENLLGGFVWAFDLHGSLETVRFDDTQSFSLSVHNPFWLKAKVAKGR